LIVISHLHLGSLPVITERELPTYITLLQFAPNRLIVIDVVGFPSAKPTKVSVLAMITVAN
jgi:hypothetical protein